MAAWRLLLVTEPGRDGVFLILRDIVDHILAYHPEIAIDLAYSSVRSSGELSEVVEKVRAHGGRTVDLKTGNAPQFADFRAIREINALVRERRPNLVHAHSSKAGALVRLSALRPGFPPTLYTPHAYFGLPRQGGKKEFVFNFVEILLGHIGKTQNCSYDERDFAVTKLRVPPDSITVIHNGVDMNRFAPPSPERHAEIRRTLGIPADGKLLVAVGRASYQKNYAPLYEALNQVLPQGVWRFAHAGAGSDEFHATLTPEAATHAQAFSFFRNTNELLQAADAFVLPSRYEGLSLSMLEALSCGLPVILAESPGLRELKRFRFPCVHWLPDPSTVPSLAPYIQKVLETWVDLTPAEGIAQREETFRFFNNRNQLEKIVSLYTQLKR